MDINIKSARNVKLCNTRSKKKKPIQSAGLANKVRSLMTAGEAAELLEISPHSVHRRLAEGEISGFKVGGLWRIDRKKFFQKYPALNLELNFRSVKGAA